MKNQESQIARMRFDAMPSEIRQMIKFCTDAVEWSLDKRWREDGEVVFLRKRITDLYDDLNSESYDDENLGPKLFQNSDLYNQLSREFFRLKRKYEVKRELLKDSTVSRKKIGEMDYFRVCYEYGNNYKVAQVIEKEGLYTQDDVDSAVAESFDINKYEFQKKEKGINFTFTFSMVLGKNCRLGHKDEISVKVDVFYLHNELNPGFEFNIKEVYNSSNYKDDTFDKNDFIQFLKRNFLDSSRKKIKLSSGKQADLIIIPIITPCHMDDDCCQRDLMLVVDSDDVTVLKEMAQIILKYFIDHPKQKK